MPADLLPAGQLIAVEGCSGRALQESAERLKNHFCRKAGGGISAWDASSLFYELSLGADPLQAPSPRTLLLLYAADLSFRLQWQIRPALSEGQFVIAAPYIETAMAFGQAAGLPAPWLKSLFRFAPAAARTYRIRESRDTAAKIKIKVMDGFVEFGGLMVGKNSCSGTRKDLQQKVISYLVEKEAQGVCRKIPSRLPARLPA